MNARNAMVGVVVASALTLAGCGTIENLCLENEQNGEIPMHVYGGVQADIRFLGEDDPSNRAKSGVDPFKVVYLTADLPLSLVADTVTLPLTLPMAYFERESHRSNPYPKVPGSPSGSNQPPPPLNPLPDGGLQLGSPDSRPSGNGGQELSGAH